MIKRLRKRFIRIAMVSVTVVMLTLSLIVNVANYISTDSDLKDILDMICDNQGTIPLRVGLAKDNAVKYASAGSSIAFSLEKAKKGIVIRTSNECEAMDPKDLDKLFDRFYRADPSRGAGTGGFGIGLSVARGIAEGHGGSAQARCPAENTIEFIIHLK